MAITTATHYSIKKALSLNFHSVTDFHILILKLKTREFHKLKIQLLFQQMLKTSALLMATRFCRFMFQAKMQNRTDPLSSLKVLNELALKRVRV